MKDIVKLIKELRDAHTGPKFLGTPEEWFEPETFFWCKNGHRSRRYLKSEALMNNVCLACFEPVYIGPKELPGVEPK